MSLFDSASLVVTPNGYKEDKLYSIKPTDGSGDLVVTRATTATRVNSDGLIEQVPYNLAQYSEQFDNAYWDKVNIDVLSNNIVSPNGSTTADKITENTANSIHGLYNLTAYSSVTTATSSIYFKKGTRQFFSIKLQIGSNSYTQVYDADNLITTSNSSNGLTNVSSSIIDFGNGWVRATLTATNPTGSADSYSIFCLSNSGTPTFNGTNFNPTYTGTGSDYAYIWGAQLVSGTSAKEYFPTTDRLNVPRLDYTNSSCPSILVEPQRTNLLTNSDGLITTYATRAGNIVQASTPINGFSNSVEFQNNLVTSYLYKTFETISGTNYAISFFVQMNDNSAPNPNQNSNLGDFSVVMSGQFATNLNVQRIGSTNVYRVSGIFTAVNNNINYGVIKYDTQSTKAFKVTGYQLEVGSYATSYIPSIASSVTRNADVISKTGISSLIGQTEGTYFVDFNLNTRNNFTLSFIRNSDISSYIGFNVFQSVIYAEVVNASSLQAQIAFNNSSVGRFKLLVTYKNNEFKFYANGNLIGTDTSGSVPSCSVLDLHYSVGSGNIFNYNSVQIYKTTLTNEQCINLTTI